MESVNSPCIKKCKSNGMFCISCYRTIYEIANWFKFSDVERKSVMDRLANIVKNKRQ